MKRTDKLTREEKQYIVWLYENDRNLTDISAITGRSRYAIEAVLRALGLKKYYKAMMSTLTQKYAFNKFHNEVEPIYDELRHRSVYPKFSEISDDLQRRYMKYGEREAERELQAKYDELMDDAPDFAYSDPTLGEAIEMIRSGKRSTILADILYQAVIDGTLVEA